MRKQTFLIVLTIALIGMAFPAVAQETATPAPEQATVDAAVQTLIAQTQQAPTQMQLTGTIQAALETALTATTQAQTQALTATPTPTPIDWANLQVTGTTEIDDLPGGPGIRSEILAPNGEQFALIDSRRFCLYQGETEEKCRSLNDEIRPVQTESARWSPDSRYLVFHEDFFQYLNDPDIWVWDTVTNEVSDLTYDGITTPDMTAATLTDIDIAPTFLPDGRILFLRYSRTDGQLNPPDIYTVNVDGSGITKLGSIQLSDPLNDPFPVYALDASAEHLVYQHAAQHESPDDGVWISDLDGGNARQIVQTDRENTPISIDLSPDERFVLFSTLLRRMGAPPDTSLVHALDMATGEIIEIDPERAARGAGWSQEGSSVIYITSAPDAEAGAGLYFTEQPGTSGRLLLEGTYILPTTQQEQSLVWGANDVVLLSLFPERGIVLAQMQR